MHPIFIAGLRRPNLVVAHVRNYIALAKEEALQVKHGAVARAIGGGIAALAVLLALGWSAVAILLGAMHGFAWVLIIVPGLTWLVAAVGLVIALRPGVTAPVQDFKAQWEVDLAVLRLAGEGDVHE